jgi:hypothetical protein
MKMYLYNELILIFSIIYIVWLALYMSTKLLEDYRRQEIRLNERLRRRQEINGGMIFHVLIDNVIFIDNAVQYPGLPRLKPRLSSYRCIRS